MLFNLKSEQLFKDMERTSKVIPFSADYMVASKVSKAFKQIAPYFVSCKQTIMKNTLWTSVEGPKKASALSA